MIIEQKDAREVEYKPDNSNNQIIEEDEKEFLDYLVRLNKYLNGNTIDISAVKNTVEALQAFNTQSEYDYLNALLHPEKIKGGKIPSPIPVPSCSFQLHNSVTVSTNQYGNLCMLFNPFFLANLTKNQLSGVGGVSNFVEGSYKWLSSFWINNDDSLTGNANNNNFVPINIGQTIPGVYDQYRLVSASIIVKYIGRMDITSGVIGGAIVFDEIKNIGGEISLAYQPADIVLQLEEKSKAPELAKFGNFDLAMDAFYHKENLCLEGMRELYFPIDNSYEEYVKLTEPSTFSANMRQVGGGNELLLYTNEDYFKNGFSQMIYVLGAPPSSSCFKIDIYCNFECLPNATFMNYMPLTLNTTHCSQYQKKNAIIQVQQKPIMGVKEQGVNAETYKEGLWSRMIRKFGNALPSVSKIMGWLGQAVSGLKPGLSIAGTLIGNALNGYMNANNPNRMSSNANMTPGMTPGIGFSGSTANK